MAEAATITFTVQNKTTAVASPTNYNACGTANPALTPVAAGALSAPSSVYCGTTTAVSYDYKSGTKVCRFVLSSFYTPASPLIPGSTPYWTPQANATSRGTTTATCKANLSAIGTNGNYSFATSIQ